MSYVGFQQLRHHSMFLSPHQRSHLLLQGRLGYPATPSPYGPAPMAVPPLPAFAFQPPLSSLLPAAAAMEKHPSSPASAASSPGVSSNQTSAAIAAAAAAAAAAVAANYRTALQSVAASSASPLSPSATTAPAKPGSQAILRADETSPPASP